MSSPREKVLKCIKKEPLENFVKGELIIEDEVIARALKRKKVGFDDRYEFINLLNLDIVTVSPIPEALENEIPQEVDFIFPDVEKWASTNLFTFALINGPFELGIKIFGVDRFFRRLVKSPNEIEEFNLQIVGTYLKKITELADRGINGIIVADDIAFDKGLYIRPQFLKTHYFPIYEKMIMKAELYNLVTFFHSDGNYLAVLNDIVSAGFRGLHCIDKASGMNVERVKKEVGDNLCLWGHLTPEDLNLVKENDKRDEVLIFAEKLLKMGGFILGTTTGLYPGINLEGLALLYLQEKKGPLFAE